MKRLVAITNEYSLLLLLGTATALIWANLDYSTYHRPAHSLHFGVNEIGMAFFFALAAKEIFEATLPGGALSSWRTTAMPIVATVGGMAGPATLYVGGALLVSRPDLLSGWAVPCATDIAFSYLIARTIFGSKHPAIAFLLLLAIVDDALGLVILALFYPSGAVNVPWLVLGLAGGMTLALFLKWRRVHSFWWYLFVPGMVSWLGFFQGGIHPALALVPVVFCMPHERREMGIFAEEEEKLPDTLNRFEHWWKHPVQVILGLFGFVNGGVEVSSAGTATVLVLVGLLAGKPLGILLFSRLGLWMGFSLPKAVSWKELTAMGFCAAIGFTVSLFIATVAFQEMVSLEEAKMGALASIAAAPLAILLGRVFHIHRKSA
ncbi:MAG: Na+/H+ antiporter NhaA [Acidobacteria bacterium]|nr:Na+/H+ antiporter NhaA [Acidobacteriota bacterium]